MIEGQFNVPRCLNGGVNWSTGGGGGGSLMSPAVRMTG